MAAADTSPEFRAPESPEISGPLHSPLPDRDGVLGKLIFAIALAFSTYQIWTSAFTPLASIVSRSIHVGFLLLMVFALSAAAQRSRGFSYWRDWGLGALGFVLALYHLFFEQHVILSAGDPEPQDLVVGVLMVVLIFEAARRVSGIALPLICAAFLGYALLGHLLPSPLNHRGFGFDQVVDHMFLGTEGVFGTPTLVSSTYIFLFILFGSFLERAGMVQLFTDLALGTVGHTRGGPAKVAVVSSALMGTINGSGVANVVTTGQFTIPLMKRFGYRPAFAGAVEATSSMGGQIMPPVMGAVAFIMAETLDVPYATVVQAAVVPALLYFASAFWMVHLEAGRLKLTGIAKADCPDALAAIRQRWYLVLPLAVLVYLLFAGFTPLYAGTVGLALTVLLVLGLPLASQLGPLALRVTFWIILGAAAGLLVDAGFRAVLGLVGLLVLGNLFLRGGRETLVLCVNSLAEGAKNAVGVGIACALVGTIVGTMTLTGLASNFARVVVGIGEHSMFLSLVLTMVTCLILGMGIPTIPNYIITSSMVGPALLELGVPLIISHMFVFYFGIMADLTPPVALAAFAAAPIARVSGMKIGLQAVRVALAGFVIPYMAVYDNALMLQGGGPLDVAYIVLKCLLAIGLWGGATVGYISAPLAWWERAWATVAAGTLVAALPITDEIGFALSAGFIGWHVWRVRRARA